MARAPKLPLTPFQLHGAGYTVTQRDHQVLHTPCTQATITDGYLELRQKGTGLFYAYAPGEWRSLVWRTP